MCLVPVEISLAKACNGFPLKTNPHSGLVFFCRCTSGLAVGAKENPSKKPKRLLRDWGEGLADAGQSDFVVRIYDLIHLFDEIHSVEPHDQVKHGTAFRFDGGNSHVFG